MSAAGTPIDRLFELLAEVGRAARDLYPGHDFALVGYPTEGGRVLRLPCPAKAPTPPTPQEGSNRETILEALRELPVPPTQRELFLKAFGGYGTGAQRRALERAVRDGEVLELDTDPKTYALP